MTRRTEEHKKSAVQSGMPDGKGLLSLEKVEFASGNRLQRCSFVDSVGKSETSKILEIWRN